LITIHLPEYKYNGARSLIILHEKYINEFFCTWKEAKKLALILPKTDDSDYKSLESLLKHVLRSSGGYITWICEKLDLPNPKINETPEVQEIEEKAEEYIIYLLNKWRTPLTNVKENEFHTPAYKSNWGSHYCIDAMLEHAVMHPIRHTFQLKGLITLRSNN
jgi:uncharacterized damage-inducible protein DinB